MIDYSIENFIKCTVYPYMGHYYQPYTDFLIMNIKRWVALTIQLGKFVGGWGGG